MRRRHLQSVAAAMLTTLLSAFPASACTIFRGIDADGLRDAAIVIRGNVTGYKILTPRRLALLQIAVSERLKGFVRQGEVIDFLWESQTDELPSSWIMKHDVVLAASILRPKVFGAAYKIVHSACHTPGIQEFSGHNIWNIMKFTGE